MATHAWRLPAAAASLDQRRVRRSPVTITRTTVRGSGRTAAAATLLDLSIYGCRIAVDGDQDEGTRIWLRFDGSVPIAATVTWAQDGRAGCRFDDPIPTTLMRELTRALH